MKRLEFLTILAVALLLASGISWTQELVVLPGGVLGQNDKAEVTGDFVRVRTGPSLEYRILTKVNRGTPVTILERDDNLVTIQGMQNYWYRIRLDKSGIEGWMFGHYLGKKEALAKTEKVEVPTIQEPIPFEKDVSFGPELPRLDMIGSIDEPQSLVTSGDLDGNGVPEIIFLGAEERTRSRELTGYEVVTSGNEKPSYHEAYRMEARITDVSSIEVFTGDWLDFPLIVVNGKTFSHIYTLDHKRSALRFLYKTDSPLLSLGSLDGKSSYLIYLKKNRVPENDGTATYFIHAATFETDRGRFSIHERISYAYPLPVKKLVTYDLNGDGSAEIICEVGGQNYGGGIVVLGLGENGLARIVNSGFITYKDEQFVQMWGAKVNDHPRLVLYTTDPEGGNEAGTSFGFLTAKLNSSDLHAERFYAVNKLLDDVNNRRKALVLNTGEHGLPFLVMDYNEDKVRYEVQRPVYQ